MDEEESQPVELTAEEALAVLQRPDAILEGDVTKALEVYLKEGGGADTAIDSLAQTYTGTAQICNIMCDWLADLGDEPVVASKKTPQKSTPKKGRGRPKVDKKAVTSSDEVAGSSTSPPKSPTKRVEEKEPVDGRQDAISCVEETLATIITRNFCPDAADRIFEDGGIGIDWLPELISHRRWRKFLYELMEQYPQCLMLNFAVKLISDAGFQNEISNVNTAAQQLDIFSRVFLTSMESVLQEHSKGCRTAAYEKAFGEMVRVVCQNEHTYVYATAVLKMMTLTMKGAAASACRHVSEELQAALDGKEYESTTTRLALMQTRQDQISNQVTQAILTMMSKNELNPADINVIYDQFIMPRPPPIDVIRDAILIEMLIDSLFHSEGPKVAHEHRDKYIFLLAYASSVSEVVNKNGQRTQTRLELDPCRHALERAVVLLECTDDLLADLNEVMHAARTAVVACGVLYYVKTLLLSEARLGDLPPPALVLLDHVATTHTHLHESVFEICCQLYEKISGDPEAAEVIMERQRLVVDRFVHLLSVGAVIPVLEKVSEMFRDGDIDASLVRYFATEVLDIIAPPYSSDLMALLQPLVADEEIFDRAVHERLPAAGEFLAYCKV